MIGNMEELDLQIFKWRCYHGYLLVLLMQARTNVELHEYHGECFIMNANKPKKLMTEPEY